MIGIHSRSQTLTIKQASEFTDDDGTISWHRLSFI